jgi:(S)-mandelate dehydrogenase
MIRLKDAITIDDLRALAHRRLPRVLWDYLEGGAEEEQTMRANRLAFGRYAFAPRVATGEGKQDIAIELFGHTLAAPFLVGPTGLNGIFQPDGDLMLARACDDAGIGMALATASTNSIEEVGAAATRGTFRMFQLYPWGGQELHSHLVDRAAAAGFHAIIVTVDSLFPGNRLRDRRNGFAHSLRMSPRVVVDGLLHPQWLMSTWLPHGMPSLKNIAPLLPPGASAYELAAYTREQRNPYYSWDDIAWLRQKWKGPLLVKGLLNPEDARRARQAGLDGIVVSNHGGRALDGAPATLDILPAMLDAAGDMPVMVDSGFRRGSDIVKALALGARCVLLGRATLYGLAAGGHDGVVRAIQILADETERVLALLGVGSVRQLSPDHVQRTQVY